MTFQIIIIAQVLVSALMTIFTRKLSLTDRKLFFVIGAVSYGVVAIMGILLSLMFNAHSISFPQSQAWPYLILEAIFIPISWLLQYKIIQKLGASNAVLTTMLNYVSAACLGFVLLGDTFSVRFLIGLVFIMASIYIAFNVQPDTKHELQTSKLVVIVLVFCMALAFAFGMFTEKRAIDIIGVWSYAMFGWSLQFISSLVLLVLYGKREIVHTTAPKVRKAMLLGFITSIAGGLYIYALSIGTLSRTVIAASGKIALVMILAAIVLKERNSIKLRISAFVLAMGGLVFLTW